MVYAMMQISRNFVVLLMCKLLLLVRHETLSETQIRPPENVTWEKLIPVPTQMWQEIPTIPARKNMTTILPKTTSAPPEEKPTVAESLDNISPEPLRSYEPPELRTISAAGEMKRRNQQENSLDKLHQVLRRYGLNISQLQDQLQNKRSSGFLSSLTGLIPGLDSLEKLKDMFLPALMDNKHSGPFHQPPRRVMNIENMRPPQPPPSGPFGPMMRPNPYQYANNPIPGIPPLAQPPEMTSPVRPNPFGPPFNFQEVDDEGGGSQQSTSGSDEEDDDVDMPADILRTGPIPPPEKHNPIRLKIPNTYHPGNQGVSRLDCEFFTGDVCLDVRMYPSDQILTSIRDSPSLLPSLFSEYNGLTDDTHVDGVSPFQELSYNYHHYYGNNSRSDDTINRRNGGDNLAHRHRDFAGDGGFICPSSVRYARPKRARSTSGQWKYIVNTKDYVQTLRMEKCLKPRESCSYVTPHYRSKCSQVYNYHRLLAWDAERTLHMDVFKIPTCCTCHIEGYATGTNTVVNRRLGSTPFLNPHQALNKNIDLQSNERFPSSLMYPRRPLLPSENQNNGVIAVPDPEQDSLGQANNVHNKHFFSPTHFNANMQNGKFQIPAGPGMMTPAHVAGQNLFAHSTHLKNLQNQQHSESQNVKKEAKVNYSYHPIISYIQKNDVEQSFLPNVNNKRIK